MAFIELKTELNTTLNYLESLKLVENSDNMIAAKETIKHLQTLVQLLNDRIEIAESKVNNAPLPEARSWADIKNEYTALYHLERLYNNNEDISNL